MDRHITTIVASVTVLVDLSRFTTGILVMTSLFYIVLLAFRIDCFGIYHTHIFLLAFGRGFPHQHMFADPMFLSMFYPKPLDRSGGDVR